LKKFIIKNISFKSIAILLVSAFFLYSCTTYDEKIGVSLDYKYYKALGFLVNNDIDSAKILFEEIVSEYPYREESLEAQVFLIWIYYLQNDLVAAEVNIDSFLKYYVSNQYNVWIKYMKALVQYEQIDSPQRDQQFSRNALYSFSDILKNQKESQYAKDAKFRIEVIKYNMAERSLLIARYYEKRTNYIGAISRYQEVIELYPETPFTQEALYRLSATWLRLGVKEEAFKTVATLGYNFPDSIWYEKALILIKNYTDYNEKTTISQ
jgi:outer membrane protein assembly factor BamD